MTKQVAERQLAGLLIHRDHLSALVNSAVGATRQRLEARLAYCDAEITKVRRLM